MEHGFVSGCSNATNVLLYEYAILDTLEKGYQVDAFYMDFSSQEVKIRECVFKSIEATSVVHKENTVHRRFLICCSTT